jgi:hypothetical protein
MEFHWSNPPLKSNTVVSGVLLAVPSRPKEKASDASVVQTVISLDNRP